MLLRASAFPRSIVWWFALLVAVAAFAAEPGPTPYPDEKNEATWPGAGPIRVFKWMPELRAKFWAQRATDRGAVVFVGDSLTQYWKSAGQDFPALKVANRGIGGDTSRGLRFRFQEDVLDLQPRALVLCIGTNDLSAHAAPADTAANIAALIAQARAQDPAMPIVLCTVPPRDAPPYPTQPGAHAELNARLRQLGAGDPHLAVLDLYAGLLTSAGAFEPQYYGPDRLHLVGPGYARWAELLRPVLDRLEVK